MRNVQGANNFYLGDKSQHFWGNQVLISAMPCQITSNLIKNFIWVASWREPPAPREFGPTKATWPNQSRLGQTWPSLALTWAEQEPTWAQLGQNLHRTRASWLQLGPNFPPTGIWRRSWAQYKPNVGNMALHEPPSKPKNVGNSACKESANWPGLGPAWAGAAPNLGPSCAVLDPTGAQVANWSCWAEVPKRSRWSPNWSHVMHMKVQVRPNMLGILWRQLRASWAQRRRNDFVFGWPCAPFWSHVDPDLGRIAPKWSDLGPSCGMLAEDGAKWVEIGPQLGPSWPKLTPSAAGSKRWIRTMLCRYANRLLAPCPGRTWAPPSWSCTRLIGLFVLNYHLRCGWIFSIFFWWEDVLLVASRLGAGNRKLNSWITLDGGLTVPNKTATQSCQHRGMGQP